MELQHEEPRWTRGFLDDGNEQLGRSDWMSTRSGPYMHHRLCAGLPSWNSGCQGSVAIAALMKSLNLLLQECVFRAITVSK